MHDLVEADLWEQLPADLYLQDEMQVAFHPTLSRVVSQGAT
jgi:hypothetical protein